MTSLSPFQSHMGLSKAVFLPQPFSVCSSLQTQEALQGHTRGLT